MYMMISLEKTNEKQFDRTKVVSSFFNHFESSFGIEQTIAIPYILRVRACNYQILPRSFTSQFFSQLFSLKQQKTQKYHCKRFLGRKLTGTVYPV